MDATKRKERQRSLRAHRRQFDGNRQFVESLDALVARTRETLACAHQAEAQGQELLAEIAERRWRRHHAEDGTGTP